MISTRRFRARAAVLGLAVILPLGYEPDTLDTTSFTLGAYGGIGQAVAVARDCSGGVIETDTVKFEDVAFTADVARRIRGETFAVLGLGGGRVQFRSVPVLSEPGANRTVRATYWNPNLSVESKYVGIGAGLILGKAPSSVTDLDRIGVHGLSTSDVPMTGHLRIGRASGLFGRLSFGENAPLYSGGGLVSLGLGYPVGRRVHFFTGASGGFHDKIGLLQQASIEIPGQPLRVHLSLRVGSTNGGAENTASVGFVYSPWSLATLSGR